MNQNTEYEMKYWIEQMKDTDKLFARYENQIEKFKVDEYFTPLHVIVDLGCGPVGGIFSERDYKEMVCVDPLIEDYVEKFGAEYFLGCEMMRASFETFNLYSAYADGIICVNALDHSGDIESSALNIHSQLKPGGVLILGVHLRTKEYLNAGHSVMLGKDDIDAAFRPFELLDNEITPAHGKHPAEYKGWYRK